MKHIPFIGLTIAVLFTVSSCKESIPKDSFLKKIVKAERSKDMGTIQNVSVEEFKNTLEDQIGTLVDVRTPAEYELGHLEGAINIDFNNRDFPTHISILDNTKPLLIYCQSGNRSGKSAYIMQARGFKDIYNLNKGVRAWKGHQNKLSTIDNTANKMANLKIASLNFNEKNTSEKMISVGVEKFNNLIQQSHVTLVDVRTADEFKDGHISGAINVDWKNPNFTKNILTVTNEKPLAIYCGSGNRSHRAMYAMNGLGFTMIYNLEEGLISWNKAKKPINTLTINGDLLQLDVANFENAIKANIGTLVDCRTPEEYAKYHIKGSTMIDVKNDNFKTELAKQNKNRPLLLYCKAGKRSAMATTIAQDMGYQVYNLKEGILGWVDKGNKVIASK